MDKILEFVMVATPVVYSVLFLMNLAMYFRPKSDLYKKANITRLFIAFARGIFNWAIILITLKLAGVL